MKVYFVGAHSTGKTTCARYVSEKYKLPMITEVARAVLSEKEWQLDNLRYDMQKVDTYQKEVFMRQLVEETKHSSFVSDRSFDGLAYAAQHSRVLPDLMDPAVINPYIASLQAPDSFIFFVRPSKATLKADGVRESLNWDGVVSIDAMVKLFLEIWGLRYFQINMDNMQERVRFIDAVLSLAY